MGLPEVLNEGIFTGLTDAECVTKLEEVVEIHRDSSRYRWRRINDHMDNIGIDGTVIATWNEAIAALPGASMLANMLSEPDGVDFSHATVRLLLESALAASTDPVADTAIQVMLDIGIKNGPRWEGYGLPAAPTEAEVTAARVVIKNRQDANALLNECINPLVAEDASLTDIKTAVANWSPA